MNHRIKIRNTYNQESVCENVLDLLCPIRKLDRMNDDVISFGRTQIANLTQLLSTSNCLTKQEVYFNLKKFFYDGNLPLKSTPIVAAIC
jgi:hypothetical protein